MDISIIKNIINPNKSFEINIKWNFVKISIPIGLFDPVSRRKDKRIDIIKIIIKGKW